MRYFIDCKLLSNLERQGEWENARKLLYNEWINDIDNGGRLVRLLSECWYILSEWDTGLIDDADLSFQTVQNTLIEGVEFGIANLSDDSRFLCITGYMISLFPYLFYVNDSNHNTDVLYAEWEQRGFDMLQKAHEINPNDRVAKTLNLGKSMSMTEYNEAKIALKPELQYLFPGDTAIELYFKDTLGMTLA
ncbi:MAG: hypothetical protein FWE11_10850 [Defluviitaleaceae bacterium]|nr:hypothetical protein [Defluviitaleaceae bacterium]